jgi:MoxR-like ATPase
MCPANSSPSGTPDAPDVAPLEKAWNELRDQLARHVVGQQVLIEQMFIALLAGGHCLLASMPGMAKSLTAATLAQALGLSFYRLRCSSDLLPEDIVEGHLPPLNDHQPPPSHRLLAANVLLMDGVDRLPPKTLNVVYQALQDREILVRGEPLPLPDPFLLLASAYLPEEDQVGGPPELRDDRFMFQIRVDYPDYHDEYRVAEGATGATPPPIEPLQLPGGIPALRELARAVKAPAHTLHYVLRLVRSTRVHEGENPDFVYEWVTSGAGPRAVHAITLAAKIRAAIHGRKSASIADVRSVAPPVLRHRVLTNRNAQSTGVTVEKVIERLLSDIPERIEGDSEPPKPGESIDPQDWHASNLPTW